MMKARLALPVLLCAALLAGCRQPGFPAHQGSAVTGPPKAVEASLPGRTGSYIGVYERGAPESYRLINQFAGAVGQQPRTVVYYSGWYERFQAGFARQARAHGAVPLIQMEPKGISMSAVAAGRYDPYLISYASAVRGYGKPVIIGFAHEMNGPWYGWGHGHTSPRTWVAAWRHIVTVFRQQGAGNVTWLWTINRAGRKTGPVRDWWPGASYVTWVGVDGYYIQPGDTFSTAFQPTIAAVREFTSRPILLSEVGIGQVSGQAAKIPDLFAGIRQDHLLGVVWFDVSQHSGIYHQDWRLEDNPAAISAFRAGMRSLKTTP